MAKEPAKSFANIITSLSDGAVNQHLSKEFHELVAKMSDEASHTEQTQKGSFTLTFNVSVDRNGNAILEYKAKSSTPIKTNSGGHLWVTPGGNLSNEKPNQPGLPMVMVPNKTMEQV